MDPMGGSINTPEIEPNLPLLPILPYIAAAFAAFIISMLVLWSTGVIRPSEYGPGAKHVEAPAHGSH